jgi:pimeloyl-ACP methyl ester carboxylesterase
MARLLIIAAVFASLAGCSGPTTEAVPLSTIELTDCSQQYFGNARCGAYDVWENRDARSGRRVRLHIVVLPARGGERQSDAVFFFSGGPGTGATATAAAMARMFGQANGSRDFVFIDVRGTGRSGALDCGVPEDGARLQSYFDEFLSDEYVRACLEQQTADVRFYTQPIAMDDVEEVRRALGYERINLFGSSGGTRQEQLYLRRYPSAVRSVVMFGVHPMDGEMPLSFSRALDSGIEWLIAWCGRDAACHTSYPELAQDWERARRRFDDGPVEAVLRDPHRGTEERVRISRGVFADGVRHMLYDLVQARRDLPARIHAAANGDFGPFAEAELRQVRGFERALAHGFYLSSTCAEDVRFIDEDDIRRATEGTFLGDYRVRRQQAACRIWPKGEGIGEDFQQPVTADVPVLVLSGEIDVATPPADGARVAQAFPNARHIVLPGQGHGFENADCLSRLVSQFIASGSPEGIDTSCVEEIRKRDS